MSVAAINSWKCEVSEVVKIEAMLKMWRIDNYSLDIVSYIC